MSDHGYMQLALAEAKKAAGRTSPNPAVGAVIVKNGTVIGKGFHERAGQPHAERVALANVTDSPEGGTIYVTLEPCNHTGRTPPCTEAIIESGIARVVVGMTDPNPHVSGSGINCLRTHGIEVVTGIREQECRAINYPFIKHITTGLPWVIMKAGLSLDGKIAYKHDAGGEITGKESHVHVHTIRDQVDAILIGAGTALIDDPGLTTRLPENRKGKDPVRVVIDTSLRLPLQAKMLSQVSGAATWIYCSQDASLIRQEQLEKAGAIICRIKAGKEAGVEMSAVLKDLGDKGVTSVLVEGGARIHGTFLREVLYDQILLYYAPFVIGDKGVSVVRDYSIENKEAGLSFVETSVRQVGPDFLFSGIRQYPAG
ncbi:MAG: riboflavin biosynthesis protein RibD [Desulfobulbus propionicus]|nr:MAG: riboflavin biosynthesis protein RibD [Desulfobulbus propionicus]